MRSAASGRLVKHTTPTLIVTSTPIHSRQNSPTTVVKRVEETEQQVEDVIEEISAQDEEVRVATFGDLGDIGVEDRANIVYLTRDSDNSGSECEAQYQYLTIHNSDSDSEEEVTMAGALMPDYFRGQQSEDPIVW